MDGQSATLTFWIQVAQLITYAFGALTVAVGFVGLTTWRRQILGARRIQLAERGLALFYEARDALSWIRNRGMISTELDAVARIDGEEEDEYLMRRGVMVGFKRYLSYGELFAKIDALRYEFAAVFGKDALEPFRLLKSATSSFIEAGKVLIPVQQQAAEYAKDTMKEAGQLREQVVALRAEYWGDDESDKVSIAASRAIRAIETICEPVIDPQHRWYSRLFDIW